MVPFSPIGRYLQFTPVPKVFLFGLIGIVVLYVTVTEVAKRIFYHSLREEVSS